MTLIVTGQVTFRREGYRYDVLLDGEVIGWAERTGKTAGYFGAWRGNHRTMSDTRTGVARQLVQRRQRRGACP